MPENTQSPELTDKEKEKYLSWIKVAEAVHKEDVLKDAERFHKRLQHRFEAVTGDEHQSVYNYFWINTKKHLSELKPKKINIKIKPSEGKDTLIVEGQPYDNRRACIIAENKVNKILNSEEVKFEIGTALLDLKIANLANITVGHETELIEEDFIDPEMAALLKEKDDNGENIIGEQVIPEKIPTGFSRKLIISRDSFRRIMIDPDSTKMFFTDRDYIVRVIKVKEDKGKAMFPDIFKEQKVGLEKGLPDEDTSKGENGDRASNSSYDGTIGNVQKLPIYEVYEKIEGNKVKRLRFIGSNKIYADTVELDIDPTTPCKLNEIDDKTYAPSDMKYYENLVEEGNFYRTVQMNKFNRSAARKVIASEDHIDDEAQSALNSNKDLEIVTLKKLEGDYDINKKFQVVDFETSNNVSMELLGQVNMDIRETAQVNDQRLGNISKAPATNASLANDAFFSNIGEQQDIIKSWIGQICRKVVEELKIITIDSETFSFTHPNGDTEEIEWDSETIKHIDYEIEVDMEANISSEVKLNRIERFTAFLASPMVQQGLAGQGKMVDYYSLVKEAGSNIMPNSNIDKIIIDANIMTPEKEQMMLMAGQPVEPTPNEDFNKHLTEHMSFLQTHPIAQTLPPEIINLFMQHIQLTQAMAQQRESMMKKQPGQMPQAAQESALLGGVQNEG